MELLVNVVFAWITVALMVLLLVIYALRHINRHFFDNKQPRISKLNRRLRKSHKWIGITAVGTGLLHGLYSTVALVSNNKGTILWLIFIGLGLSFYLRKPLKKLMPWIKIHRYLAAASMVFLLLHLIDVEWFVGMDTLVMSVERDIDANRKERESKYASKSSELAFIVYDEDDLKVEEPLEVVEEPVVESAEVVDESVVELAEVVEEPEVVEALEPVEGANVIEEQPEVTELAYIYNDGTYYGEAMGFGPGLIVKVVVKDDLIISVEVVEHNEQKRVYYEKPIALIPEYIISAQSVDVDIVSGATYTSYGIMDATADALKQAKK